MVKAANLGFPRMGRGRELKKALEGFWAGRVSTDELETGVLALCREHWRLQRDAGLDWVPCNDFSLYDHMLDTACMVGAVPERFQGIEDDLSRYFAMARGARLGNGTGEAVALEMTKWIDTNYHYLVPELREDQEFRLATTKPIDAFLEGRRVGTPVRPVLVGPVSFLLLSKSSEADFHCLELLPRLMPVYEEILRRLSTVGAKSVQIDEPCLTGDVDEDALTAVEQAYGRLVSSAPDVDILLATYFGSLGGALQRVLQLPVAEVHLDLVRGRDQFDDALELARDGLGLSLGLVDGRNVWKTDLEAAIQMAERACERLGQSRLTIAPSCSLLHVPVDLSEETTLDPEIRDWLAFAVQKIDEVATIAQAVRDGREAVADRLEENRASMERRRRSPRTRNPEVRARLDAVTPSMLQRESPYEERRQRQRERAPLPLFPTTSIGSLPQTPEVRKARASYKAGRLCRDEYETFIQEQIREAVSWQEEADIDVLVHGEFERNDMVEYFGESLIGFAFTRNGWVQSYGSRCVKPPILFGDVSRPGPMTVETTRYAQSLTSRPVKGMLTGPVTILQWSFVRDDQPRADTCRQLALAIRDEVADLQEAGAAFVQIDEPALREGLPLKKAEWDAYLRWAVDAFRLASAVARDDVSIHTHMCYCEFNDIIASIAELDADAISIETARSQMEILKAFADFRYPNEVGPGVYDIHSPRVPSQGEMEDLLEKALRVLPPERIWVNPDCGLKTRRWEEVKPAIAAMVAAAKAVRDWHPAGSGR